MTLDTVIILLCLAAAVAFIGNKAYRAIKGTGGCGCGCSCGKAASRCDAAPATPCHGCGELKHEREQHPVQK